MAKLLIDYANENKFILEINDKNDKGWYPLLKAIYNDNFGMIKLPIDYVNKNKLILEINEKDNDGYNPLLKSVENDNIEIIELLLKYSIKSKNTLKINEKESYEYYSLLRAINNNNTEIVNLLIDYANITIDNDNNEMVKLLIDYAKLNQVLSWLFYGRWWLGFLFTVAFPQVAFRQVAFRQTRYCPNSGHERVALVTVINILTREFLAYGHLKSIPRKIVLENLSNKMYGCPVGIISTKCCDYLNIPMAVHTGNNYKNKKIDYANKNQIIFKINEKDIIGKYPLLKLVFIKGLISKVDIEYALRLENQQLSLNEIKSQHFRMLSHKQIMSQLGQYFQLGEMQLGEMQHFNTTPLGEMQPGEMQLSRNTYLKP
ncbi:hypothetical protein U3516DRAFT_739483 [Neocallimastix sp. 'constans']